MRRISRREFLRHTAERAGVAALGPLALTACGDGASGDGRGLTRDAGRDGSGVRDASGSGDGGAGPETADAAPDTFTRPAPPRNIVLVTADDLGWRDLSCYGNDDIATQNIDRLADEGVRFDDAFVTASSCSPSRATLMTGQWPHTNGVTGLTHEHPDRQLPEGYSPSLPALLRDAGYRTACEGKWHVAPDHPTEAYGYEEQLGLPMIILNADTAVRFIEENQDRPFYLELNYINNHRNLNGDFHQHPDAPVSADEVSVPDYWALPDWPEIREELACFYSQTLAMDHMVGRVLDALDRLGLADDTLVLFVSDNGAPYPGNKMTCYDRGIGTPLLARWPRAVAGGRVDARLVSTLDIVPTILDAAGVAIPDAVQGRSFLPALLSTSAAPHRDAVFAEMTDHVDPLPTRAVRTERFKYIRNYSDDPVGLDQCAHLEWAQRLVELPDQPWTSPRVPEELYDLASDPNEQTNLVDDPARTDVLADLRARLDAHMAETDDPYLGAEFVRRAG